MESIVRTLKYLWASPYTLLGAILGICAVFTGGQFALRHGALEFSGGVLRRWLRRLPLAGGAAAITFGHTILALDEHLLDECRDHEWIHVRQYERWGLLFVPAYLASSLLAAATHKSAYAHNLFEREAYGVSDRKAGQGWIWRGVLRVTRLVTLGTLCGVFGSFFARWHWLADLATHFQPHYAAALVLAAVTFWIAGQFQQAIWIGTIALVPVAAIGALFLSATPAPFTSTPFGQPAKTLRITVINVLGTNRQRAQLVDYLRRERPDIVVALEVDEEWQAALDQLKDALPHARVAPRDDSFGIAFYSRVPLERSDIFRTPNAQVPFVGARCTVAGRKLLIVGLHVLPPGGKYATEARDGDLQAIAQWIDAHRQGYETVVAGDFNCTPWSPALSDFERRADLVNSLPGHGIQGSWPSSLPCFRIPIDHVFVSPGLSVEDRHLGPRVGSDHLPVTVVVGL